MEPKWLSWAREMQAIAQTGLTYSRDVYDSERYEQLRALSVEIMQAYTEAGEKEITMSFAAGSGYATPKVDVRGVIFQEGKLLLVREKSDGCWCLPGGWAESGLSPNDNVVKEIREESGLETRAVQLLAVLDKLKHQHPPDAHHIYKLFILCEVVSGSLQGGLETSEAAFFGEHELPPLSLSRNTASQLSLMFDYMRDPAKPVHID
ncbi:NUDIX hydrolase [Paenibacillus herberti]|uniref:ADP-ribose pyrophosphatase n=1 Tax=Paenibacillus herberti TaxID=1619309 RepID=A0A229NV54_9BACL|nr:NUDIX hydrolase [Paenibacillus herberti]OXM13615.1 ADP-ribose pyrophosphatase [Paenibacillus herberti]